MTKDTCDTDCNLYKSSNLGPAVNINTHLALNSSCVVETFSSDICGIRVKKYQSEMDFVPPVQLFIQFFYMF